MVAGTRFTSSTNTRSGHWKYLVLIHSGVRKRSRQEAGTIEFAVEDWEVETSQILLVVVGGEWNRISLFCAVK